MKRTLRLILVFLLAAILLACPSCAEENGSKREGLTVSFLSVGQGDAILITLPEGNLLIDGGGDASFAASFAEELERAGVDALDCLIITHPERDHVAYLPALLEEIPVRRAFLPYIEEGFFPLFDETARLAREKGCAVEYTELYDSFAIGGARFVALSPAPVSDPNGEYAAFDGAAGDSANDLSAVFYLEYEGTRFLLTGDASSAVEKNVMRRYEAGLYARIRRQSGGDRRFEGLPSRQRRGDLRGISLPSRARLRGDFGGRGKRLRSPRGGYARAALPERRRDLSDGLLRHRSVPRQSGEKFGNHVAGDRKRLTNPY